MREMYGYTTHMSIWVLSFFLKGLAEVYGVTGRGRETELLQFTPTPAAYFEALRLLRLSIGV